MLESESFRNYVAQLLTETKSFVEKARDVVIAHKGNKIAAIYAIRGFAELNEDEFKCEFPEVAWREPTGGAFYKKRIGFAAAKTFVERFI